MALFLGNRMCLLNAAATIMTPDNSKFIPEWKEEKELKQMAAEWKPHQLPLPEDYFWHAWNEMGVSLLQSMRDNGMIKD